MAVQKRMRRVTMLRGLGLPTMEAVLAYGAHAEGWQFVGRGTTPLLGPEHLGEIEVDGLIGMIDNKELADRAVAGCGAVVNVVANHPETGLPAVGNDDRLTGELGAEHLMERGFAGFGFVDETEELGSQRLREGFVAAVEDAGRACHVLGRPWGDVYVPHELIRPWLAELPTPIAVMAHNDHFARQTIDAALQLNLRVPDDVAVLGVNNNPWTIAMSQVPLSSIELDNRQVGLRAAKLLDGLMDGEAPPPTQFIAPVGVVARRSTDVTMTQDPLISHAMRFIRDHVTEGINVEDVLNAVNVSRSTLVNRMRQTTGRTPHQAIVHARIEHAKSLLVNTDASMDEIARRCGFLRQPRLNETFKRITRMTPGQFRQQRR